MADLVTVWLCGQSPTHRPLGSGLLRRDFPRILSVQNTTHSCVLLQGSTLDILLPFYLEVTAAVEIHKLDLPGVHGGAEGAAEEDSSQENSRWCVTASVPPAHGMTPADCRTCWALMGFGHWTVRAGRGGPAQLTTLLGKKQQMWVLPPFHKQTSRHEKLESMKDARLYSAQAGFLGSQRQLRLHVKDNSPETVGTAGLGCLGTAGRGADRGLIPL